MALARIQLPKEAKRGELVEVRIVIQHPMETGFRRDAEGRRVPRNAIHSLACRYNGAEVFRATLSTGIAANPYLRFSPRGDVRIVAVLLLFAGSALAQPRSGLEFAGEEVRALQASDAENPGMLWVDRGAALFAQHCASCHTPESMKGAATRYPRVADGKVVNLEAKIRHNGPQFAYESDELLSLTAYVAHQSRGLPIEVKAGGDRLEAGRKAYYQRRGQMNLSCAHCHEANPGKKLGAETLSQGQPNGFPAYRLEWQTLGSLHRRLRACMYGLHAEPPPYGSALLLELELFLATRARGLPVEAPAVRR